jgi:hypothetical protein
LTHEHGSRDDQNCHEANEGSGDPYQESDLAQPGYLMMEHLRYPHNRDDQHDQVDSQHRQSKPQRAFIRNQENHSKHEGREKADECLDRQLALPLRVTSLTFNDRLTKSNPIKAADASPIK